MNQHPSNRLPGPTGPAHPSRAAAHPQTFRPLPRYRLILLNNAARDMMFVVRTIMELIRFCREEATHKMWEAHHCGRSLLLLTYRERAELYVEQFASRGLEVTIEPAG
jgi:ATP-dependent Clp protease adapter protein ClpS